MTNDLKFPLIELTEWVFEDEKVFFEILEEEVNGTYELKESEIENHYNRKIVDSNGFIIKITDHKVVKESPRFFSLFSKPSFEIKFTFQNTGERIPMNELKQLILAKSGELFHITYNKLLTEVEFRKRLYNANEYERIISIATFIDE